ncbi:Polyamine oxidase 1 [Seminavis robusta]|uniref:Amine oxidase n=1 Tax=Seminavis robusta TaxID=568900 RepID=A0A9N8DF23_9STRA|nr:Polyamine oxidase 1 [Seminavis robusta]|eukprot:Sro40_g024430.1 Polyamine oxidase 1 (610) ;mRNA; f:2270-4099
MRWSPIQWLHNLFVAQSLYISVAADRSQRLRGRRLRGGAACVDTVGSVILEAIQKAQDDNNNGGGKRRGRNLLFFDLDRAWNLAQDLYGQVVEELEETSTQTTSTNTTQGERIVADVVIVGAGAAGLSAAAELLEEDPDLNVIILESTERIGGRVRSHTMGAWGREAVVEDGANWIIPLKENVLWEEAQDIGLRGMPNDYTDWIVYDANGTVVDPTLVDAEHKRFTEAFIAAGVDADEQFTAEHESFNDRGVLALLEDNGWAVASDTSGNLDAVMQWLYIDYEYAVRDVSTRYFPYEAPNPFLVTDQRGYETLLQHFQGEHIPRDKILLNQRVTSIDYDADVCIQQCIGVCVGPRYKAIVKTEDGTEYLTQRVILTVSTGVINNDRIDFNPSFQYPHAQYNPYRMAQYVKIFYQFEEPFWGTTEFVEVARNPANRGLCNHWQNMDLAIPGSGIIRCELMTEGFLALIDPVTEELSHATLDSLLDPLRAVYGNETVGAPLDVYYPKINKDVDFGNGAYGAWQIGKSFTDFAKFYGGIDVLTNYCDHNGCNSAGEWILQMSGSASCYDHSEFVHGALFAGQRSARFALESLGYDVKTDTSECDKWWNELER